MKRNPAIDNYKRQIEHEREELAKLREVKEYIRANFCATTAECDAIFDVIAQVADKRETHIKELKEAIISAI